MKQKTEQILVERDMGWVKSLLNNIPLLRWVKKFTANNLFTDNKLVQEMGIKTNEDSISVGDEMLTKIITTHARYAGKEFVRFNIKQLKEVLELLGDKGELIISSENKKEMFVQIDDTVVIVCPLPEEDREYGNE
jgi:hypothetical protein